MALSLLNAPLSFGGVARAPVASRATVQMQQASKELTDLAKELNPVLGYYDPLGLGYSSFWEKGQDATVGWLRHAEIKHGRVAMAAFVGYIAQYNGLHFGFPKGRPAEKKAKGLLVEINNGRLAMIGIMGFLAEQKVPGAVPALAGLVKPYAGEVMAPF